MTKEQIKAVFDRVQNWPLERQEDAAKILTEMEAQNASPYHLSDKQVEEVRRRLADPDRKLVSHDEARARIKRLGA
ncbi:MAG: hypothetical protein PSV22_11150 [Pseudolabrys sp.]|nr:hypothetical protein [Pseudolabrys sp.]